MLSRKLGILRAGTFIDDESASILLPPEVFTPDGMLQDIQLNGFTGGGLGMRKIGPTSGISSSAA